MTKFPRALNTDAEVFLEFTAPVFRKTTRTRRPNAVETISVHPSAALAECDGGGVLTAVGPLEHTETSRPAWNVACGPDRGADAFFFFDGSPSIPSAAGVAADRV